MRLAVASIPIPKGVTIGVDPEFAMVPEAKCHGIPLMEADLFDLWVPDKHITGNA